MKELSPFSEMFLESLCEKHRELFKPYLEHLEQSYVDFKGPICGEKLGIHPVSKALSKELFIQEFFICLMKHRIDNPQEYYKFKILVELEKEFEREYDTS